MVGAAYTDSALSQSPEMCITNTTHDTLIAMHVRYIKPLNSVGFIPQWRITGMHVVGCMGMCNIQIHHFEGHIR